VRFIYFLIILLFLGLPFTAVSQDNSENSDFENLDDLFAAPAEDIIVEESELDNRSQFETSEKIKFSGSFNALGAVAGGWTDWDFLTDVNEDFEANGGIEADLTLNIDIRPSPVLNIYASVYTEFDPYSLLDDDDDDESEAVFTSLDFETLYCNYILSDILYTRFGMFTMSWGQGRFYTPGDLMEDSSDSDLNLRFNLPGFSGLSFVMLTNNSTSYSDFTYAAKADFIFGDTMIGPGISYKSDEGLNTLLSFKQVLFGTDFSLDFTNNIADSTLQSTYVVMGFYHEWSQVVLYGEYQFSWQASESDTESGFDNQSSMALKWKKPFGTPFNLGMQWEHYFTDGSGVITPGLSQGVFPYVTLKIAMPIIYGDDDSQAVSNNDDDSGRRIYLAVALDLSVSF
jgi:hypothetical protein